MKKLCLSRTDKKILGVCGGIAEMFKVDSTLVRLALVFLCLITGAIPLIVTYIIAGIITPEKPRGATKNA